MNKSPNQTIFTTRVEPINLILHHSLSVSLSLPLLFFLITSCNSSQQCLCLFFFFFANYLFRFLPCHLLSSVLSAMILAKFTWGNVMNFDRLLPKFGNKESYNSALKLHLTKNVHSIHSKQREMAILRWDGRWRDNNKKCKLYRDSWRTENFVRMRQTFNWAVALTPTWTVV